MLIYLQLAEFEYSTNSPSFSGELLALIRGRYTYQPFFVNKRSVNAPNEAVQGPAKLKY